MAGAIRGITVEIGGDTTKLGKALAGVNSKTKDLQNELRGVNTLLKFDPGNVTLLKQKQDLLNDAIATTKQKLDTLKSAQSEVQAKWEKYAEVKPQLEKITQEVADTEKQLKTLKKKQEEATAAFEKGEISEEQYNEINQSVEKCEASLKDLKKEQSELNSQVVDDEQYRDFQREIVNSENKLKSLTKELKNFGSVGAQQVAVVGEKFKDVGSKIENAGKKISGFSAAAGGVLVGATKAAIDYESAWTGVTKTVDGTDEQLEIINQGILDLSKSTASSAVDIAGVAEAAGQLGIETDSILTFTETMVKLGDSTNLSAEEAASALAKFANITNMSADDYGRLGSVIVDLGNNFATTESDIVAMATRLASTGEITGLTEPQIMALSAALSSAGIEAEAGGSAMAKLLKQLYSTNAGFDTAQSVINKTGYSMRELQLMQSNNGKGFKELAETLGLTTTELSGYVDTVDQMNKYASTAGLSIADFRKAYGEDAVEALSLFIGGLNETERNGKSAVEILNEMGLTEVRLSNAVLAMASSGDLMTSAIQTANGAWEENNALNTEAEKRYATSASKLTQLKNTVIELGIKLGEVLLPIVNSVVEKATAIIDKLTQMDPATRNIIVIVTAVVAALGPLLIGIGKLITSVGTIMTAAPKIVSGIKTIGTGLKGLFGLITAHPIIAIVTAVIAALVLLYNKCEWFRDAVHTVLNFIKDIATKVFNALVTFFTVTIPEAIDKVVAWFKALPGNIQKAISTIPKTASNIFQKVFTSVTTIVTNLKNKAVNLFNNIKTSISTAVNNIKTAVTNAFNTVKTNVTNTVNNAKTAATNGFNAIKNGISNALNSAKSTVSTITSNIKTTMSNAWTSAKNTATNLFGQIGNAMKTKLSSAKSSVVNVCSNILSGMRNAFSGVWSIFSSIGGNVIEGIKSGISNAVAGLYSAIKNALSGLVNRAKRALGIASPSRVFRDVIGKQIPAGIAVGVTKNADTAEDAVKTMADDLSDQEVAINGATINRKLHTTFGNEATATKAAKALDGTRLMELLQNIHDKLDRLQVVLDSGELVGGIIDEIDGSLSDKYSKLARGW